MVDQGSPIDAQCPSSAALLGYGGVAAAVCLSNWGSAVSDYESTKCRACQSDPSLIWILLV